MLADIMETFKINKRTDSPVTLREIKKPTLFLSGNSVCLIASMSETYDLSEGSRLNFHKSASGNSGQMVKVCEDDVIIEKIVDVKTADGLMREIYFEYTYIEPFTVTSFVTKPPILGGYNYKLYFDRDCLIAPGDFAKYKEQTGKEYIVYCKSGKDVIHFSSPALCYPYEFVEGWRGTVYCSKHPELHRVPDLPRNRVSRLSFQQTPIILPRAGQIPA